MAPGRSLVLAVAASVARGVRSGAAVAASRLAADAALLAVSVALLAQLSDRALGVLGVFGALFVGRTAWDLYADGRRADLVRDAGRVRVPRRPVRRGALARALSPSATVFWIAAGGPQLLVLFDRGGIEDAAAFAAGFGALALAGGCGVAVVAGTRKRLGGRGYRALLAATAVVLAVAAAVLAVESARLAW